MMQRLWLACGVLVLLLHVAPTVAAQNSTARLRLVHAAQQVAAVDILVEGKPVLSNHGGFLEASSYFNIPAGKQTVTIVPSQSSGTNALATATIQATAGQSYTLVVGENSSNKPEAYVFEDDLSPLAIGKARVRFIHMSPDAPGADIEVLNGPTLFENVGFGQASNYETVDAETYNIRAVTNGTNTAFTQLSDVQVQAGLVYDIVAADRLANLQVKTLSVPAQAQTEATPETMPVTGGDADFYSMLILAAGFLCVAGAMLRRANRS